MDRRSDVTPRMVTVDNSASEQHRMHRAISDVRHEQHGVNISMYIANIIGGLIP